jgi:tetratricopeptide (TPR) repeat protein
MAGRRERAAVLGLLGLALSVPAGARDWLEVRSPRFVVVGDASESSSRQVALELERIREILARLIAAPVDPTRPLLVFAMRDEVSLRALAPWFWEGRSVRPAGFFVDGYDRHDIVLRADVAFRYRSAVVYHEYLHLVVRQNSRHLPLWLNEGLAAFFATTQLANGRIEVGRLDPETVEALRGRRLLPIERLGAVDQESPEYKDSRLASVFYAQSALLTHFLLLGPDEARDARATITDLLLRSSDEVPVLATLGDPATLDRALQAYLRLVQRVSRSRVFSIDEVSAPLSVRRVSEAEALALRGDFLARRQRAEGAPLIVEALRVDSRLAFAHEAQGRVSYWRGRKPDAAASLARSVAIEPASLSAWFWLGLASPRASQAREMALRRAVELGTSFAPARQRLAEHLRERGTSLEEAVTLATAAVSLEPGVPTHRLTLEASLLAAGRADEAAAVEAALQREALRDPTVLRLLSQHYERTGRAPKADVLLTRALESRPSDPDALDARATYLWSEKRYDEAELLFRAALKARPRSSDLMNSLGFMNAERGKELDEALRLIDQALERRPTNASYLDSRGWALFRLGRLEEASKCLARAVEVREDPELLDHLGDVLDALGRGSEARAAWRQAIEHDDATDDLRARVRSKVERPVSLPRANP